MTAFPPKNMPPTMFEYSMAFTSSDLDAINAAIATGELTVEYNGRRVTYRSMADLLQAKRVIEAELQLQPRPRTSLAYRDKG
jgi:hypothetical protein